jgi:pimeloyl-ACP methyl ester carboxylesterase
MRTHSVIGGGIRLHVDEAGHPDGQPVLFLHGFSQCRLAWSNQLDSDLSNDLRLIAPDLRGHGLSDKPRDAYGEEGLGGINLVGAATKLGSEAVLAVIGPEFLALVPTFFSTDVEESVGGLEAFQ